MKLSKVFEPGEYEKDIYQLWESDKAFVPTNRGNDESFTVIMPPPNANASLHAGHSLTYVIQDIMIRYQRMQGKAALYVPGADHAGFETQVVYEKQLAKEGKSRFDFSREELYKQIWDFVQQNKSGFEDQLRALGISCDWDHFTFTLDDKVVNTAYNTFQRMWNDNLIYRGKRIVNFCTFHGTSFSDIEVAYKEQKGKLYHIKYPLTDGSGEITVATTRPETLLGDTAVAVHPKDDRYQHLVGKTAKLPLTDREIPIIADEFVDRNFGSGAVKVTPAHDPNDYEIGQRHDLPFVHVINAEGKLSDEVPEVYRGLPVKEAREQVVTDLKKQGFLSKEEDHTHSVGHCYKCDTVIEPLLRDQWFISMKPLAAEAIKALKANKIKFYPASKKAEVIRYLEGVKDWNISRQIAWGIPIPAFQNVDNPDDWIFDTRVDQEIIEVDNKTYHRDPDVFDTWFSSGQWPYITLDYPDSDDFKRFYPTDLMESGVDILFQWVSRMIVLGIYVTGEIPFKTVYLHGMVRSADGRKMSKSLGNVIPLEETVQNYGADALRAGIISGRTAGYSSAYAPNKIQAARNFANKLWNVARYIEDKVGDNYTLKAKPEPQTSADHWILQRLQKGIDDTSKSLDAYDFAEAFETVYHLLWNDLADWYIEASKTHSSPSVLAYALETILKLAHPFVPFVTETIWQTLKWEAGSVLATSSWPKKQAFGKEEAAIFEEIRTIISEIRYMQAALQVNDLSLYFTKVPFLKANAELLRQMAQLNEVREVSAGKGLHLTRTKYACWLDINPQVARGYINTLEAQKAARETVVTRLTERLGNKAYTSKAPKEIVRQTKEQLATEKELLNKVEVELNEFKKAVHNF